MAKRRKGTSGWSLDDLPDHLKEQNRRLFERAPQPAPARRAPSKGQTVTEHDLQVALITRCNLLAYQHPELARLFAIPNGAKLPYTVDANGQRVSRQGAFLRAEGLKSGVPDLFLPAARGEWHGLFIEMKRPGNKPSENQTEWMGALTEQGYLCAVCYSDDEALDTLLAYLNKRRRR